MEYTIMGLTIVDILLRVVYFSIGYSIAWLVLKK